jgi:hypothetical protein
LPQLVRSRRGFRFRLGCFGHGDNRSEPMQTISSSHYWWLKRIQIKFGSFLLFLQAVQKMLRGA